MYNHGVGGGEYFLVQVHILIGILILLYRIVLTFMG